MESVDGQLVRVIAEEAAAIKLGEIAADEVTEHHILWRDGGEPNLRLDSLDIFELVCRVEQRTGREFHDLDFMAVGTVSELVERLGTPVE